MESGGKCALVRVIYILFCLNNFVTCGSSYYLVNVALGKPARQSSDYIGKEIYGDKEGFNYSAALAVDGNNSTNFHDNSCSNTASGQTRAWWEVDLKGIYLITKIKLFQRTDSYANRNIGSVITGVLENNEEIVLETLRMYDISVVTINIQFRNRFKTIRISNGDGWMPGVFLCLCEVEVFADLSQIMCRSAPRTPDNSQLHTSEGITGRWPYRSQLTISCNHGYYINGVSATQCADNGQWDPSNFGSCSAIICPSPPRKPDHSQLTSNNGTAGKWSYSSILTITCDHGYELIGVSVINCTDNGRWNQPNFGSCSAIMCQSPPNTPSNSQLHSEDGIAGRWSYSSILTISCNPGYYLIGPSTIVCADNGQWKETDFGSCSAIMCRSPPNTPSNSQLHSADGIAGLWSYTSILTISCNPGYYLIGPSAIVCADNGQWNETDFGNCSALMCRSPPTEPDNSKVHSTDGIAGKWSYSSILSITCNEGYYLSGSSAIQCADNGQWNQSSFGTCLATQCMDLLTPNHSNIHYEMGIEKMVKTYNSTVLMTCDRGYSAVGNTLLHCNDSGQWNGSLGSCIETQNDKEPVSGVSSIAGGVTATLCVLILGAIIAFILYKRRTRGPEDKIVDTMQNEKPNSSEGKEQEETVTLEKSIYAKPKKNKNVTKRPQRDEPNSVYMTINDSSNDYYSFTSKKMTDKYSIRLEDLSSFFLSRKSESHLYEEEYNRLPNGLIKSHEAALLDENRSKNRYKNMYPYDDTRVKLEIWDPSNENDYINACYINGFKNYHCYIAAQGPTKGILNDFWRMIWQTKCSKIVMLTNLMEEGKHKCEKYWPDNGSIVFGDIVVKLVQCETFADFTIRTLEIKKKTGKPEGGKKESHQIKQFHFTSWPDRGVPRFASSLVHFRCKIHDTKTLPNNEGPMVVHCSAGIGRTGTFLALDYLIQQAQELGYINVVNCLETLRKQRVSLVQTIEQYIFLHEALMEALTCTTMAPSTGEFQEAYRSFLERDNVTGKRRLDVEFENLPMYVSDPDEDVYENAKNMENRDKNRYSNILPDKNYCPFLNVYVKGRESYINAVFLPAYKESDIFIITQTPLENTIVDFWRMVYQFEVGSIVMLNTLSEMKEEERYWTEDEETLEILPFRITLESKYSNDISTNYTMLLNYHDERRRVRLSRASYWADGKSVPKTPSAMLKQIDLIQNWQQETGNKPIIVHCMNGAERSGLFCVIAALLERIKTEQDVAVEQIIKQMRSRRPQIIPNVDQFKFCYDSVLAFLDQFDAYSNFA